MLGPERGYRRFFAYILYILAVSLVTAGLVGGCSPGRRPSTGNGGDRPAADAGRGDESARQREGGRVIKTDTLPQNDHLRDETVQAGDSPASLPPPSKDPADGIDIAPPGQLVQGFWAAYDEVNNHYLLVWMGGPKGEGRAVVARLVGRDGHPIGDAFEVGEGMSVSVAFEPGAQRYLVAYSRLGRVMGQVVAADGKPVGKAFEIAPLEYPRNSLTRRPVAAAANGHGRFLVAWTDNANIGDASDDVYLQMVSADGKTLLPGRQLVAGSNRNEYIGWRSVLYDPGHERFVVMWEESDPGRGLYYRFVDVRGRMGPRTFTGLEGVQPAMGLDVKRGRLLLVWEDKPNREPRYRLYDVGFKPLGPENRLPGRQRGVDLPSPAYDAVKDRYLITWRNDFERYFFGQWITADGRPDGAPFHAAVLSSFSQVNFPLPRRGGGFMFFYEDASVMDSSEYDVLRAKPLAPGDKVTPAVIRNQPGYDD